MEALFLTGAIWRLFSCIHLLIRQCEGLILEGLCQLFDDFNASNRMYHRDTCILLRLVLLQPPTIIQQLMRVDKCYSGWVRGLTTGSLTILADNFPTVALEPIAMEQTSEIIF
ncbi:hypothetical protein TcWFU_008345 [Taenia crassiceps]|uniref:Uncharacterized protein n=1 Tax=Taenia crassiceps TaxID=6207 RepID=A0ABR4QJT1_9CEST